MVWASWSTVRWFSTAMRDRQDQLARLGRHHHPADDLPGRRAAEQLDEAVRAGPAILARALPASGSMTCRAGTRPASTSAWETPTVASSGSVKTLAATVRSRSGATASPSACHIAIRPCIAATLASGSTPVQSPAA